MTIDTNQFWNLISESQLVPVQQVQTLFSEFSSDASQEKTAVGLANWMVKKKAISNYQAKIVLAGHSGPFQIGKYTIVDRIEKGLMKGHFAARHTRTKYPVLLQFLEGSHPDHLPQWNRIESATNDISKVKHPNVVETFESVVLPEYRFVVSQFPTGPSLCEKIPRKARLPWKVACGLVAQAAMGLEQIHQSGLVHGSVSPRTIWINKNGGVQLRLNPLADLNFLRPDKELNGNESYLDYRAPECFDVPTKTTDKKTDNGDGRSTDSMHPNLQPSSASDVYSLGCTLFRAIAGKTPFPDPDPKKKKSDHQTAPLPDLKRLELPADLETLLGKMLAKDPQDRPELKEVFNLLALHSGKAKELKSQKTPASPDREKFRKSLTEFITGIEPETVAAAPTIATDAPLIVRETQAPSIQLPQFEPDAQDRSSKIEAAALAARKRKKGKWKMPVAIAAALLVLSGVIGGIALMASRKPIAKNASTPDEVEVIPKTEIGRTDEANTTPPVPTKQNSSQNSVAVTAQPALLQSLIDDDNQTLWETPTNGENVDFSYLPQSPKILFSFRPADLIQQPEGERTLKSLGPKFSSQLQRLELLSGLELENIEQLNISMHSNEAFEYEPYFVVKTTTPIQPERMLQLWNGPTLRTVESQDIYESSDGSTAFLVIQELPTAVEQSASSNEASTQAAIERTNPITRFAFGNKKLIEEVALSASGNVLSGSLLKLAKRTDGDRHFNMLFLRSGLFNDEGQKLMGEQMNAFNRELRIMLPDNVRGGLVSLHIDSGSYFEVMLDRNVDLKAPDLKKIMEEETRGQRNNLMQYVSKIPPNAYWDQVRFRYASMLTDFNRNLRWNVENGEVTANCWLPSMAAHNLLAASELVITFSNGGSAVAAPAKTGPQTLQELIALKRDLNIANPPDLNVLMSDLQSEIQDDLGKLPFAFNIRLIGSDLESEGITKNQRPGELVIEQKSLAEILTTIMVGANPDKDIAGASDPNCKLIWVVADDPENPGQNAILITTRKAAAQKSYTLPSAFRTE